MEKLSSSSCPGTPRRAMESGNDEFPMPSGHETDKPSRESEPRRLSIEELREVKICWKLLIWLMNLMRYVPIYA